MTRNNKKIICKRILNDYDAVSLYPSAMFTIPGFALGKCKLWNSKIDLKKVDYYILKIKVTKIRKKLAFPILCHNSNNKCNYDNAENQIYYVDKIKLEDAIKFQKIEYEIIEGIYYN